MMSTGQFVLLLAAMILLTGLTVVAISNFGESPVLMVLLLGIPLATMFLIVWSNLRPEPTPQLPTLTLTDICRAAMRRVNMEASVSQPYTLTDIGLLAYTSAEDKNPLLIRAGLIPKKVKYLQPFAEVEHWRVPDNSPTAIVLQICEEHGEVCFQYEYNCDRKNGRIQLILPTTWLEVSMAEKDLSDKNWSIRVHVNGKLLALHLVYWSKFDEADIKKGHRRDGEISPQLRRLMEQERDSTNISLDDLLVDNHE